MIIIDDETGKPIAKESEVRKVREENRQKQGNEIMQQCEKLEQSKQ